MAIKTTISYSPNFLSKKRKKRQVKYLIFHYTGMKSENSAIKKLTNIQSEVSTHYFIKSNGEIILMVPELYVAWHAGKSRWKETKFLNNNSIGIEISNKGHQFGYQNFTELQIKSLIKLSKYLIKRFKINKKNILGHSDIAYDRKKDPGEKFPWQLLSKNGIGIWHNCIKENLRKLRKKVASKIEEKEFIKDLMSIGYFTKNLSNIKKIYLIKAFQRRFRPELINGRIDKECLLIASKINNTIR
jgi:N-acetylmuramoyl-L-alanine amidase